MNKSVYSIVLMDDVVDAVDRMAYSEGTSRSNLINRILAEHLSCRTPEQRINSIFGSIEQLMNSEDCFQIIGTGSDAIMSIKSALRYKYKPTIKYAVEIYKSYDKLGELRVSFRTQNMVLINTLTDFFKLWSSLEKKYISKYLPDNILFSIEDGKYTRQFAKPQKQISFEEAGNVIADYIRNFDYVLKTYFQNIDQNVVKSTENAFVQCLKKVNVII